MNQETRSALAMLHTKYSSAIWKLVPHSIPPYDLPARFAVLNQHEQLFLAIDCYASNTSSNGCSHFFYYGYGILTDLVLQAYLAIGLPEYEARIRRYIQRVFGDKVPEEEQIAQTILEERQAMEEEIGDELSMFLALHSDEFSLALMTWVRANREHFRVPPALTEKLATANF